MGIPVIGCDCEVCRSTDSKNHRWRQSIMLEVDERRFIIDTGPDFREQALHFGIDRLDGALLTHMHFDHISGIDELRVFYFWSEKSLPILCSLETYEELKLRYHYLVDQTTQVVNKDDKFNFQLLKDDFGQIEFEGVNFGYLSYHQAGMKVTGYRYKNFAYVTDIRDYTEEVFDALKGVDTLVLSALRQAPSPVHFSFEEAVAFAERSGARQTYLVHIAHDSDHETENRKLSSHIQLAYDGMEISL